MTTAVSQDWMRSVVEKMAGIAGVSDVVILTGDGLMNAGVTARDDLGAAQAAAAAASGFLSCGKGIAQTLSGQPARVLQGVVETDIGFVVVIPAAENTFLALNTTLAADIGQITYEAKRLIERLGDRVLGSAQRDAGT